MPKIKKLDSHGDIIQKPAILPASTIRKTSPVQNIPEEEPEPVIDYDFVIKCATLTDNIEQACAECPYKKTFCRDGVFALTDAQHDDIARILMMDEGEEEDAAPVH